MNKGDDPVTTTKKLQFCEGDCDADSDCGEGLTCRQRDSAAGTDDVKGCLVKPSGVYADVEGNDYCVRKPSFNAVLKYKGVNPTGKLQQCEGDCDSDAECASGLACFQRDSSELVPGCRKGGSGDSSGTDYCVSDIYRINDLGVSPDTSTTKLKLCEGDCDTNADCGPGLKCEQRSGNGPVTGCVLGSDAKKDDDYCVKA